MKLQMRLFSIVVILTFIIILIVPFVSFGVRVVNASPDTLIAQPSVKDIFIYQHFPTDNYGTDQGLELYDRPEDTLRSALEFDISEFPVGATMTSATLQLYYHNYYYTNPVGKTVWVYKLNRTDWVEDEATWNIYKTGNNWTVAGGDYVTSSPVGGNTTIPANYGWMSWNVTTIVQDAHNNTSPAEFLMKFETEGLYPGYSKAFFYSNNYVADTTLRPKLTIEYIRTTPTITTNDATYVSRSTARLNSYLNDDGGEPCDVRFQYSTVAGGSGTYENFSNFTEVDPNNHLNLTTYHVDHRAYDNEDCYLYDDKGAGNITGFTHGVQIEAANIDNSAHGFPWVVANVTDDTKGMKDANEPYLEVYLYANGGALEINLVEGDSGSSYTDMHSGSFNTSYYLTLIKGGTDLSCEIFSDAGRTTSLDLLNLTLHANHTFRYVYAGNTWNDSTTEKIDVDIDNLCLTGTEAGWTNTSWVNDTYTTGDSPYADIAGLALDTTYYFRVQARNTLGTTSGSALNFTTYPAIYEPTNFTAYPDSTTISLTWTKGTGASNTMIRQQAGAYPTNYTDGKQVYAGTMATALDSGLSPGITYYYRSWSFDAAGYSDNYTDILMTTSAYTAVTNDTPATPTQPSNWWGTPDYTRLSNIAGYGLVNEIAEQYGIPYNTFWMSLILIAIMCIGLFIYSVQHNITVALGLMGVLIIVASVAGLLPLWLIAAIGIPVGGIMLIKRRV